MAGPGRAEPHPSEELDAISRPLCRGRAAAAAADRGLPPGGPARLVRGPGAGDLRGVERARVPQGLQGLSAPARLAVAARRASASASPCAIAGRVLSEDGDSRASPMRPATPVRSSPTPRSWRSAARAGRGSARTATWVDLAGPARRRRSRPCDRPIWASRYPWSEVMRSRFEGEPLKRIALAFEGRIVRGEAIVTADGIEGGAVYALSARLRDAIGRDGGPPFSTSISARSARRCSGEAPERTAEKANPPRPSCARPRDWRPVGIALLREAAPCPAA